LAGAVVFALALLVVIFFNLGWATRLAIATLLGLAAALPLGFVAKTFLPVDVPDAINHRHGTPMWEGAAKAGLRAQVIHVPATFPAEAVAAGQLLAGPGVPDMRGRVGTPSFYTSDRNFQPGGGSTNEFSLEFIRLDKSRGSIGSVVMGPYNKPFYDYVVDRKTA